MSTNIKIESPDNSSVSYIYTDMLSKYPIAFDAVELGEEKIVVCMATKSTIRTHLIDKERSSLTVSHVLINTLVEEYQEVLLHIKVAAIQRKGREMLSILAGGETGNTYLLPLSGDPNLALHVLKGHYNSITSICVFKTLDNRALTSSTDGSVILWDLSKGEVLYRFLDVSCRQLGINSIVS